MADTAPLAGVRVLDLTQFLSGPYCTQMLGDLGATVIKLEAPQGDLSRYIPPHFVADDSLYYLSINRNKKSVVADMKTAEGRDIVRRLALACDIVIENFRPGVLDRLGLSAAALRAEKPGLIWCSISGFGQTGPYRDKPAYDMIVQALSGGMSLTGEVGGAPVRAGIPIGDLAAGMYAAVSVLAALNRRHATGVGDCVDISMLDCQAAMLCYQGAYHLHSGVVPGRQGAAHDAIPTYRSFRCGDGLDLVTTANTERMWQGLCRAVECTELLEDARFRSNADRHRNRSELAPLLEAAFLRWPAAACVARLEAEAVPVGVVNTLDRVMEDPQIRHRDMVVGLAHEDGRQSRVMGNPMKFADAACEEMRFPPALGADTAAVLREVLEIGDAELAELAARKIIVARDLDA